MAYKEFIDDFDDVIDVLSDTLDDIDEIDIDFNEINDRINDNYVDEEDECEDNYCDEDDYDECEECDDEDDSEYFVDEDCTECCDDSCDVVDTGDTDGEYIEKLEAVVNTTAPLEPESKTSRKVKADVFESGEDNSPDSNSLILNDKDNAVLSNWRPKRNSIISERRKPRTTSKEVRNNIRNWLIDEIEYYMSESDFEYTDTADLLDKFYQLLREEIHPRYGTIIPDDIVNWLKGGTIGPVYYDDINALVQSWLGENYDSKFGNTRTADLYYHLVYRELMSLWRKYKVGPYKPDSREEVDTRTYLESSKRLNMSKFKPLKKTTINKPFKGKKAVNSCDELTSSLNCKSKKKNVKKGKKSTVSCKNVKPLESSRFARRKDLPINLRHRAKFSKQPRYNMYSFQTWLDDNMDMLYDYVDTFGIDFDFDNATLNDYYRVFGDIYAEDFSNNVNF